MEETGRNTGVGMDNAEELGEEGIRHLSVIHDNPHPILIGHWTMMQATNSLYRGFGPISSEEEFVNRIEATIDTV